jgi:hypothetical protein
VKFCQFKSFVAALKLSAPAVMFLRRTHKDPGVISRIFMFYAFLRS